MANESTPTTTPRTKLYFSPAPSSSECGIDCGMRNKSDRGCDYARSS
jgi:hypothetical protein